VLSALGLTLAGCFLYRLPPPEAGACAREARAHRPDLTGTWETHDGVRLDVRHQPSNESGLDIAVAAGSPKQPDWNVESAGLRSPEMLSTQPPVCGEIWRVDVTKRFPGRRAVPGQFISQNDRLTGRLVSADRVELDGGEVWTRVGAVGALRPPTPGEHKLDVELSGSTLSTTAIGAGVGAEPSRCMESCKRDARCAASVQVHRTCRLLASVTGVTATAGAWSWINPDFDFDPPSVPVAGYARRGLRLRGVELRPVTVSNRAAQRECARACDEDWSCKGHSVGTWDGECHLLSSVTGAQRADDTWYARVQPERVAIRPAPGRYAEDTRLAGTMLRTVDTQTRGLDGCHEACTGDASCAAFSFRRIRDARSTISWHNECVLMSEIGRAEPAQHWIAYAEPPRPTPPTEPPSQRMSSPLCQGHPDAQPAYAMTTSVIDRGPSHYLDLTELPFREPSRPSFKPRGDRGVDWTSAFFVRPLAGGSVHMHAWYRADLVLKVIDGEVAVGAPDASSAWRIEHLWEHMDPPRAEGVWYVVRSAETGMFLAAGPAGIRLVGNPSDPATHWRFDTMVLPTETRKPATPFPVVEPPPMAFDETVVAALTRWAVVEELRQQVPACYKRVKRFTCPASGQPFDCGALCTRDLGVCVETAVNMTVNVGILVANVAGAALTGGAANAAIKSAQVAGQTARTGLRFSMKTAGRALSDRLKKRTGARVIAFIASKGKSEPFRKLAGKLAKELAIKAGRLTARQAASADADAYVQQQQGRLTDLVAAAYADEVARRAAEAVAARAVAGDDPDLLAIAATLDPTGVAGVIDSFTKPMCEENPLPALEF
jgi:hypothetical protein